LDEPLMQVFLRGFIHPAILHQGLQFRFQ
jgi:hypothetical protein